MKNDVLLEGVIMIIAAACKMLINNNEVVLCGVRHRDIYVQLKQMGFEPNDFKELEQGFVTYKDIFLNRKEALIHAISCGQICIRTIPDKTSDELISEDLW